MDPHLRQSPWARLTAVGFIVLILLGNYWFVLVVTAAPVPLWFERAFYGTVIAIGLSGTGLLVRGLLGGGRQYGEGDD